MPSAMSVSGVKHLRLSLAARIHSRIPGRQIPINYRLSCKSDDGSRETSARGSMGFEELEKAVDLNAPGAKEALKRLSVANERFAAAELKRDSLAEEIENFDPSVKIKQAEEEAQAKADQLVADAELVASEKLLKAAELRVRLAEQEKQNEELRTTQGQDRVESVKAGALGGAGGLIALAPLVLTSNSPVLTSLFTVLSGTASCGLFGITYRYATSANVENRQLKTGVISAFSVVRGLAEIDAVQAFLTKSDVASFSTDIAGLALFSLAQSFIIFGFAAVALEASMYYGILKAVDEQESASTP